MTPEIISSLMPVYLRDKDGYTAAEDHNESLRRQVFIFVFAGEKKLGELMRKIILSQEISLPVQTLLIRILKHWVILSREHETPVAESHVNDVQLFKLLMSIAQKLIAGTSSAEYQRSLINFVGISGEFLKISKKDITKDADIYYIFNFYCEENYE